MGNRTAIIAGTDTTRYTFDDLNRLQTVTDPDGGVTAYTIDRNGNRESIAYPNGTVAEYTYDSLNRLTKLFNRTSTGDTISCYEYTLGLSGNRTQVTEHTGRIVNYTYDDTYKLTGESIVDPDLGSKTIAYTYDAVGNRLSKTEDGIVTSYNYDDNDRLTTENLQLETCNYSYDDNGNTLSKTSPTENIAYTYDYNNRLISVDDGTDVVEYAYDTDGMRVQKSVNGEVTNYLLDKNRDYAQVIKEYDDSDSTLVSYIYGDDLISQKRESSFSYYHYDGQLSVHQLTDNSGEITDTYTYDAFGLLLALSGSTENIYLYTGEQYDPNVGFYYLRARYYNPSVGRFLTQDTWPGMKFEPMSLHKYLYCDGNPINRLDPSGMFSLAEISVTQVITNSLLSVFFYTSFKVLTTGEFPELWEYFVVAGIGAASSFSLSIMAATKVASIYKLLVAGLWYGIRYTIISGKKGEFSVYGLIFTTITASFAHGLGDKLPTGGGTGGTILKSASKSTTRTAIKTFAKEFCSYVEREASDWMDGINDVIEPYIDYILHTDLYIEEHGSPPTIPDI